MQVLSCDVERLACACCGSPRFFASGFLGDERETRAGFRASCYPPHGEEASEIWFEVILGTWGTDDNSDHVSFSCRYGEVDGGAQACSVTNAADYLSDSPVYGERLSREQALEHPLLDEMWSIVDFVLDVVPAVADHRARFHPSPRSPGR